MIGWKNVTVGCSFVTIHLHTQYLCCIFFNIFFSFLKMSPECFHLFSHGKVKSTCKRNRNVTRIYILFYSKSIYGLCIISTAVWISTAFKLYVGTLNYAVLYLKVNYVYFFAYLLRPNFIYILCLLWEWMWYILFI